MAGTQLLKLLTLHIHRYTSPSSWQKWNLYLIASSKGYPSKAFISSIHACIFFLMCVGSDLWHEHLSPTRKGSSICLQQGKNYFNIRRSFALSCFVCAATTHNRSTWLDNYPRSNRTLAGIAVTPSNNKSAGLELSCCQILKPKDLLVNEDNGNNNISNNKKCALNR